MKIIILSFFILFSPQILAHECVLKGTSAEEITIYNTCKADQKNQLVFHYLVLKMIIVCEILACANI